MDLERVLGCFRRHFVERAYEAKDAWRASERKRKVEPEVAEAVAKSNERDKD